MVSVKVSVFHLLLLLPSTLAVPAKSKTPYSGAEPTRLLSIDTGKGDPTPDDKTSTIKRGGGGGGSSSVIDFDKLSLQLPIGKPGNPTTISGSALQGSGKKPDGFEKYFQIQDGGIKMMVPGSPEKTGCVHTKNSKHCRTELREANPKSWDPRATINRLSATLTVIKADDSQHGTCIGQIHIDDSVSVRPVCELYYNQRGDLTMGVEQTREGGNQKVINVGNVPVGMKFSYVIAYEKGELSVVINGGKKQVLSQYQLANPLSYFKAGNYNQGNGPSEVKFYSIQMQH